MHDVDMCRYYLLFLFWNMQATTLYTDDTIYVLRMPGTYGRPPNRALGSAERKAKQEQK